MILETIQININIICQSNPCFQKRLLMFDTLAYILALNQLLNFSLFSSLPLFPPLPSLRLKQTPRPTPGTGIMPMATMAGLIMPTVTATLLSLTTPL